MRTPETDLPALLIGDDADAIQPLVDVLTAHGDRHRILGLPVSDADEENLEDALRAAAAEEPTLRILHLAALDSDTAPSMRSLLRMQHRVLGGTQRLFRAAAAAELRTPIWLVTRGAQRVTDADTVSPVQSCLWGFGHAASLEHPQVWGGLADLSTGGADEWSRLINQVRWRHRRGEDQLAMRDQTVYVPRLIRRAGQPIATPLVLRDDATYLVTGGLGSVGLEIAGYLAAHGARHLVLSSRRSPGEAAQTRIDAIGEQYGCEFLVVAADVANPHDVARLVTTVQAELPPLAGIIHAAGEIGTTPLRTLDAAEVDRVFAGKVWGAWNLSEAHRRPETGLLPQHLFYRLGVGQFRPDRLRRGQRLPRRVGVAAARPGCSWDQRELRFVVGGHGRRGRPCAAGSARRCDFAARRCPGGDGRAHGRPGQSGGLWRASTGPASCRSISRRAEEGRSLRRWSVRCLRSAFHSRLPGWPLGPPAMVEQPLHRPGAAARENLSWSHLRRRSW